MARTASRSVFTLVAAVLAMSPAAQAADGPVGRFCGKLDLNGQMVEAETSFSTIPGGSRLSGSYKFRDRGKMEDGRLVEPSAGDLTRRLVWNDRYGGGWLVITFSPDYTSFKGMYGMNKDRPRFRWTGVRCLEPDVI